MPPRASEPAAAVAHHSVFAAIVGTGFSGLAVARELKRAGIDDLVPLERAEIRSRVVDRG